jgi:hypothetical protein
MFWIVLVLGLIWLVLSIKKVKPTERAVKVIFEKMTEYCKSGLVFVPFLPSCRLERRPTTVYELVLPPLFGVTTAEGDYQGEHLGAVALKRVQAVAYVQFPKHFEGLKKAIEAGVPEDKEKMTEFFRGTIEGALRTVLEKSTWKQAKIKLEEVRREVETLLTAGDSGFRRAGFGEEEVSLAITEFSLPDELEKSLTDPEIQRHQIEAEKNRALIRAAKTAGLVVEEMAEFYGVSSQEIQQRIFRSPKLQKEFREKAYALAERQMAIEGKAFIDIRVPDGTTLEGLIALLMFAAAGGFRPPASQEPPKSKRRMLSIEEAQRYFQPKQ